LVTVKRFPVAPVGEGKPDYSRKVAEVAKGKILAGYALAANESLKMFQVTMTDTESLFPGVRDPLPPGETAVLVDLSTNLPMPYTVVKGHALRYLSDGWSFSKNGRTDFYLDGTYASSGFPSALGSYYYQTATPFDTRQIDPLILSHTLRWQITNLDETANMLGTWNNVCIESIVGSPPFPKTKTVKCRACGETKTVKRSATKVKCDECGEETWYYAM